MEIKYKFHFDKIFPEKNPNKMNQSILMHQILLVVLLIASQCQIECEVANENSTKKPPPIRLRSFNIHQLKILRDMAKDLEARRKLQEEIEREALRRRKESEKREEMEKRRLIQNYFNAKRFQSKGFLNDFNVNRFF
jgi:hypothetical protein